ncbi:hypothetical protein RJ55_02765 [Drechmeria coniospora]|nr:hypothetical protein RJ55_02765 [Drechmeria coniospora]
MPFASHVRGYSGDRLTSFLALTVQCPCCITIGPVAGCKDFLPPGHARWTDGTRPRHRFEGPNHNAVRSTPYFASFSGERWTRNSGTQPPSTSTSVGAGVNMCSAVLQAILAHTYLHRAGYTSCSASTGRVRVGDIAELARVQLGSYVEEQEEEEEEEEQQQQQQQQQQEAG